VLTGSQHGGASRRDQWRPCHNPGSWDNSPGNVQTLDFKVMIHKIHRGANLPSVLGPDGVAGTADDGKYMIGSADFSTVVFPQDVRNCTKCHDGADPATPQGDNWKIQPSREACGSCHDNVNFATGVGHAGGSGQLDLPRVHSTGGESGPVSNSLIPGQASRRIGQFKFTVLEYDSTTAGARNHHLRSDGGAAVQGDPAFTAGGASTLNVVGVGTVTSATAAARGYGRTINLLTDPTVAASAVSEYTVTGSRSGCTTGSMIFIDSHLRGCHHRGDLRRRLLTKSVFKDFAVSGTLAARRLVVDIGKCDSATSAEPARQQPQ
jgi:hypothetical protein